MLLNLSVKLKIDDAIDLELLDTRHATALHELVKENRQHLREWLPWVDQMRSLDDFKQYIRVAKLRYGNHVEMGYVIMHNGSMIGRIGIYNIDLYNKTASIGYWLGQPWLGKGIITNCCKKVIDEGFSRLQLNRIEIRAAEENLKSQAIPERLGFKKEGIIRQAEFVNNRFVDLFVYSMLKEEWTLEQ